MTCGSEARLALSTNGGGDGSGRGTSIEYRSFHQLMITVTSPVLTVCAKSSYAYLNSSSSIEEKAVPQSGNIQRNAKPPRRSESSEGSDWPGHGKEYIPMRCIRTRSITHRRRAPETINNDPSMFISIPLSPTLPP